jgi:hypothetical protein
MPIVNGRCIGDLLGNFTCFNTQGQSTMDYLITNERLLNHFKCDSLVQINFEGALRKSVHVPLELLKLNLARISHDILRWQSE